MINVRTAVRKAVEYVREFQDYLPQSDVRLEETEYVEPDLWLITLSFTEDVPFITDRRTYKEFRIDADTGDVKAMKVRSLASAK